MDPYVIFDCQKVLPNRFTLTLERLRGLMNRL
jgi:hypothetical protein